MIRTVRSPRHLGYELGITPDDYDAQLDVDFSAPGKRVAAAA